MRCDRNKIYFINLFFFFPLFCYLDFNINIKEFARIKYKTDYQKSRRKQLKRKKINIILINNAYQLHCKILQALDHFQVGREVADFCMSGRGQLTRTCLLPAKLIARARFY